MPMSAPVSSGGPRFYGNPPQQGRPAIAAGPQQGQNQRAQGRFPNGGQNRSFRQFTPSHDRRQWERRQQNPGWVQTGRPIRGNRMMMTRDIPPEDDGSEGFIIEELPPQLN